MRALLSLLLLPAIAAFECWQCGPFMDRVSDTCKSMKNLTCAGDKAPSRGCYTLSGKRPDGTFFIEKNCVPHNPEYAAEGCRDFSVPVQGSSTSQHGTLCVCKDELCNAGHTFSHSFLTLLTGSLILISRLSV